MFRFTIRDVLWLTVVVGMSIGWWQAERRDANHSYRLTHLRANFDDVVGIAKELGLHVTGDAEKHQIRTVWQRPAERSPTELPGGKYIEVPVAKKSN